MRGAIEQFRLDYRYLHPARGEIWLEHIGRAATRDAEGRAHHVRCHSARSPSTSCRGRAAQYGPPSAAGAGGGARVPRARAARRHQPATRVRPSTSVAPAQQPRAGSIRGAGDGPRRDVRRSDDIHSPAYQQHAPSSRSSAWPRRCGPRRDGRSPGAARLINPDPSPDPLTKDVASACSAPAHEGASNAAQHAGAHMATVRLRQDDGGLLLAVSDDGARLILQEEAADLGLLSIANVCRWWKGTLDVESAAGEGTTVISGPVDERSLMAAPRRPRVLMPTTSHGRESLKSFLQPEFRPGRGRRRWLVTGPGGRPAAAGRHRGRHHHAPPEWHRRPAEVARGRQSRAVVFLPMYRGRDLRSAGARGGRFGVGSRIRRRSS